MSLLAQLSDDLEALVARASPAVAGIRHRHGQGSGLLLTPDGYALTNAHVVRDARKLGLRLADGVDLKARLVGLDPPTDLAVVRVDAANLPTLPLADPGAIRVGQLVVAIGNPFQLERSVSLGVVSAVQRSLGMPDGKSFEGLVQTDAAINPGNSGGPLLNVRGEVVGINTVVMPYAQGIGFAVPASTASWVAALLIQRGVVRRRYLGIAARAEPLGAAVAAATQQARGVRVMRIEGNAPADRAGLREGDLLLGVNGASLGSVDDLQRVLALASEAEVRLDVWRAAGHRADVHVHAA